MTRRRIKPNLEMSEDLAYILGVLKGDGWCGIIKREVPTRLSTGRIDLLVSEEKFAQSFHKALKNIGLNPTLRQKKMKGWKKPCFYVCAYSKTFAEWYVNLTLTQIENLLANERWITSFVRGFYESDGSVYNRKNSSFNHFFIYNSNSELINLIQRLLHKIGIRSHKRRYVIKKNIVGKRVVSYRLRVHDKESCLKFPRLIQPCIKGV